MTSKVKGRLIKIEKLRGDKKNIVDNFKMLLFSFPGGDTWVKDQDTSL